jgi:hypothetical protein
MFKRLKVSSFLAYKSIIRGNRGTILLTVLIISLAFMNLMFISSVLEGHTVTSYNFLISDSFFLYINTDQLKLFDGF